MAFLSAPSVGTNAFAVGGELRSCGSRPAKRATTMKYGDYSYSKDRTKGHVGQYYVDKFRVAADFVKGVPESDADAVLGRTAKGAVAVPLEGVPQIADGVLARDPSSPPDPRIAESNGEMYPWDANYKDPKFASETFTDVNNESIAEDAFIAFRDQSAQERGAMLTRMDFNATLRNQMREEGLSESFLLTLDGQHDRLHAQAERMKQIPFLTPTGKPQSEIAGTDYLGSVGAFDFMKKKETEIAFWKSDEKPKITGYKRPKGANAPELPYNTNPTVEAMQEAQRAAGIIAAAE